MFQEPEILQTQSNEILTAIVHGMKKEEPRYGYLIRALDINLRIQ